MSTITSNQNTDQNFTQEKEQATKHFLAQLKEFWVAFWAYTEETGESDTSSFDGIL